MSGPAGYPIVIGAVWVALILLLTLAITSARRDRLTAFREAQREWLAWIEDTEVTMPC